MILGYLALAWLLGLAAAAFTDVNPWASLAAACLLAAATLAYRPRPSTLPAVALAAALIATAAWRFDSTLPPETATGLAAYNDGEAVRFRALVTAEPDQGTTTARYRLSAREVFDGGWQPTEGGVLMYGPLPPRFQYGDLLELEGKLETPPAFEDFNYRDYLLRQGIGSTIAFPETHLLAQGQGNPLRAGIIDLRQRLTKALEEALPEPQASLSAAILLGQRSALPQDLSDDLNATGTSHLVAISGQNVALVAGLLMAALAWLVGRRPAAWLALAAIIDYAILVGGQPSVLRAAVMGSLYVVGVGLGRQSSAPLSLALAAAAMTGFDPQLAKDVSFQLSFAATLGLMTLAPALRAGGEALASRWAGASDFPLTRPAIELLAVTLAAIAFTLPLVAINFHRLSLVAPLANLLAVPAFVAVIVTAAITAIAGALFAPAADALTWLAWPPPAYLVAVVRATADLPFASLELDGVGVGHAIGYFAALTVIVWFLARRRPVARPTQTLVPPATTMRAPPWQGVALILALSGAVLWLFVTAPASGRLSVTFLDVGQGDAILIRGPQGHSILVDGGPSGEVLAADLGRRLPFWEDDLDLVVLSHPDADHLTGLLTVLDRYDVRQVLASPIEGDSALYRAWREAIAARDIPYYEAQAGGWLDLGDGARVLILHPPREPLADDDNNNSVVLQLVMGRASILLTADLEAEGEFTLLANAPWLRSAVLQVPHHGSRSSSTLELLRDVQPLLAVVSVGEGNRFGHPAPEVLERLPARLVYRTDLNGDITVSTDGRKLWIETQRSP